MDQTPGIEGIAPEWLAALKTAEHISTNISGRNLVTTENIMTPIPEQQQFPPYQPPSYQQALYSPFYNSPYEELESIISDIVDLERSFNSCPRGIRMTARTIRRIRMFSEKLEQFKCPGCRRTVFNRRSFNQMSSSTTGRPRNMNMSHFSRYPYSPRTAPPAAATLGLQIDNAVVVPAPTPAFIAHMTNPGGPTYAFSTPSTTASTSETDGTAHGWMSDGYLRQVYQGYLRAYTNQQS